jgi:voltage-gated potassium channel
LLLKHFLLTLLVPPALVLSGTIGYHFLEGMSLLDALYLTIITLTTVGYGDLHPVTPAGKLFTMVLVLCGVFTILYAATSIIRAVVSGEVADLLGKRYMERALANMRDHLIVCGYGRMGRLVCREFAREEVPFVVIDVNPDLAQEFPTPRGVALIGDATSDEILRRAGIERARGLVTVMASDADNLYTTMSARLLNANLFIVARVEDPSSEPKLLRAGANRVVSPYLIGGNRVAQAVLRPTVMDFIELATRTEHIELQMEETQVAARSPLAGTTLQDSKVRADLKIIIVAIKKPDGEMVFNPTPDAKLAAGDILVAIGHREHLDRLDVLANKPAS